MSLVHGSRRFQCNHLLLLLLCLLGDGTSTLLADELDNDWPMWGRTAARNMVSPVGSVHIDFDTDTKRGILWTARLGSETYGNPVVAGEKVFIGTNNGGKHRPAIKGDRGCLLAFDSRTGRFLWQLTRDKLKQGRANDWPEVGIASTPCVLGDRLWVVSNRAELLCIDTEGFQDGENDGLVRDEVHQDQEDADIVWILDMIETLGVFPQNLANSSPLVIDDMVYVVTSNGKSEDKQSIPSPLAPSFLGVAKESGQVVWKDHSPGENIIDGQWGSPAAGIVAGKPQLFFPGGDGWIYALDPKTGAHLWKCNLNAPRYVGEDRDSRNAVVATPVFFDNSVILGVGRDPEQGEGTGHLYRIDATRTGDITDSGILWHYGGEDGEEQPIFRRTLSTVAVVDGLVYAADIAGFVHCLDLKTGEKLWIADLLASTWGSPFVVDGKLVIGDEDGDLAVLKSGRKLEPLFETNLGGAVYGTPAFANGTLFVSSRSELFAIDTRAPETSTKTRSSSATDR
ncbi:MAG: PQQ-binding-like beta-propeller repeat protein [Planctomycetota bacterium]